ncbi:nibrin [Phlebotomus papatasi]|uniref:nibrin n=1 Tax=Phlebotomus papatasi TaxID=29031 RepID=UPI002483F9B3|nr:nibrin [Phlebotomus papatasi]
MWILSNSSGRKYFVSGDKDIHIVGRDASCNLMIEGDKSISRHHGHLKASPDKMILIDIGSTYGIFLNENIEKIIRLPQKEDIELKAGDNVRFGRFESKWTVEKIELSAVTSSVPSDEGQKLLEDMKVLCGKVSKAWSGACTHLVMPEIIITMKALLALVSEVPIVRPDYFSAFLQSIREGKEPPRVADFSPKIREDNLIEQNCSFQPDSERKKVFSGKRFIFLSREVMNLYQMVIQLAGGISMNIEADTLSQKSYVQLGTIVISSETRPGAREWDNVKKIEELLKDKGCRFIPEKEIALAIIYKSTRKFCNPRHDFSADFLTSANEKLDREIIVQDTPSFQEISPQKATNITLPETVQDPVSMTLSEKPMESSIQSHVEIPETLENDQPMHQEVPEPPKSEKRRRTSWITAEKEAPPPKSQKKTITHTEATSSGVNKKKAPENKSAPPSTSGEKRKLRSFLDSTLTDDFDTCFKKPRKKAPETLPVTSQRSTRSSAQSKSQESSLLPLSRSSVSSAPVNKSTLEIRSTGWLSKKFSEATLDDSSEVKEEKMEEDGEKSWIDSMKVSVETKVVEFSDSRMSSMVNEISKESESTNSRNFKAFKKKQTFIQQKFVEKLIQIGSKSRGE